MYAGTTFRKTSGHLVGVHQRIDRVARRNITRVAPDSSFPSISAILHFEGNNGPDGIKRKSPSVDEPWHFIDPTDPTDTGLIQIIEDHIDNLAQALKEQNESRAAFEAAWLAHAITDGLTPAHHYPLADKIEELWGKPHDERDSVKDKGFIVGDTRRDTILKNWEYWGAKGVFSTHLFFELGVALAIRGHRFRTSAPDMAELAQAAGPDFAPVFRPSVETVYQMNMYERFWRDGWSTSLALETRNSLMPEIIRCVTLAWYAAIQRAAR